MVHYCIYNRYIQFDVYLRKKVIERSFTCAFAEYSDIGRVPAKVLDVILDPDQRCSLVPQC